MQIETWKSVPGYEGHYEVSDLGNVRSLKFGKVRLLHPSLVGSGYPAIGFRDNGKVRAFLVHRLVMLAFVGERPEGMSINHIDGVKTNNNLSNLEYITQTENMQHAIKVLGKRVGGKRKLTESDVCQIRQMKSSGITHAEIAKRFNVARPTVTLILSGHSRSNVTESAS